MRLLPQFDDGTIGETLKKTAELLATLRRILRIAPPDALLQFSNGSSPIELFTQPITSFR